MIQFLVHEAKDTVGVATTDIPAGQTAEGLFMDNGDKLRIKTMMDIPLGHKIALKDLQAGETIIKYGHDIGKVVAPIKTGEHVHIHNLKTKRW